MNESTETLYCIVSDESGHEYLIADTQTTDFRKWVEHTESASDEEWDGVDYDAFRFNGPASFWLPADMRLVMNRSTGDFSFIPGSSAIVKVLENGA